MAIPWPTSGLSTNWPWSWKEGFSSRLISPNWPDVGTRNQERNSHLNGPVGADEGSLSRFGFNRKGSARQFYPFLHAFKSEPPFRSPSSERFFHIEPLPIVLDCQFYLFALAVQREGNRICFAVLGNIGKLGVRLKYWYLRIERKIILSLNFYFYNNLSKYE